MTDMVLDPARTALVVVDMQNGFCHPEGSLYAPGSDEVIEPVTALVSRAHEQNVQVIYTQDIHPPDQFEGMTHYDEFDRWGEHVVEGSWDAELVEELPITDNDHIVEKHTYDAFYETELDGWLSARGIDTLVFCGTLANVCVLHTASSAGLRDYRPMLIEDAIGYIEEDHREYALNHAEWLFGEITTQDSLTFGLSGD